MFEELARKSSFLQQVQQQVDECRPEILTKIDRIGSFRTQDMDELINFFGTEVEQWLDNLCDGEKVVAAFPTWPHERVRTMRMGVRQHQKLLAIECSLHDAATVTRPTSCSASSFLTALDATFTKAKQEVEATERARLEEAPLYAKFDIPFNWALLKAIKSATLGLARRAATEALHEYQERGVSTRIQALCKASFELVFRAYRFAEDSGEELEAIVRELADAITACVEAPQTRQATVENSPATALRAALSARRATIA